jgi:DNA helicase HerA-like ATPase
METRLARLPFLRPNVSSDSIKKILDYIRLGRSIVLEFGRHNSLDATYWWRTSFTRRLHEEYVEAKDKAQGNRAAEPPHLVITIEEAHKFLSPQVADQTIFGTIARECASTTSRCWWSISGRAASPTR